RMDGNDLVLEKLFAVWFEEAVLAYGWSVRSFPLPLHAWDWPKRQALDIKAEADATDKRLRNGTLALSRYYAEQGEDYEDELDIMAADYGVTPDEMRTILLKTLYPAAGAVLQPA